MCFFTAIGNQSFLIADKSRVKLPEGLRHKKVLGFAFSHEYVSTRYLLLHGENEFSLFKCNITQLESFQLIYEGETKDWINAATFLKDEEHCQFVLHMAHSALLLLQYNIQNETLGFGNCSILEFACCTDYSMLYHTTLFGNRYKDLIVISSNGFGEILIWQPQAPVHVNSHTYFKIYPLRLRLKAHNGVIFSIDISFSAKLLVTTSDDRSLKFWQLESESTKKWNWSGSPIRPMFSCYGHTARVMCAIIVEYGKHLLSNIYKHLYYLLKHKSFDSYYFPLLLKILIKWSTKFVQLEKINRKIPTCTYNNFFFMNKYYMRETNIIISTLILFYIEH